eukprot:CAMPEP_0176223268 /NCGR_PEP_ID=MMETSP0121_2-20121125/20656_1 /TAXON_ID=160619 /ORGANISM="Kryptoperidinium foliaceum, Strain CCMP 1326" /LENGTH=87 /DNA_ID=CAMNT_0017562495 /DNA_START=73 /DNA_END=333 /DNA_ORIENTATION=-
MPMSPVRTQGGPPLVDPDGASRGPDGVDPRSVPTPEPQLEGVVYDVLGAPISHCAFTVERRLEASAVRTDRRGSSSQQLRSVADGWR